MTKTALTTYLRSKFDLSHKNHSSKKRKDCVNDGDVHIENDRNDDDNGTSDGDGYSNLKGKNISP